MYGGTEFGGINHIYNYDDPSDWGYIRVAPHVDARFIPQHDDQDTYELVFVVGPFIAYSQQDTWG
jgi:hypothetical protein